VKREEPLVNDELIIRYLAGEAGPEEAMMLHAWMEVPENLQHFQSLQDAWMRSVAGAKKVTAPNTGKAWEKLDLQRNAKAAPTFFQQHWLKIAASLLIAVAASLTTYFMSRPATVALTQISTHDSLATLKLSDQSEIVLGKNSSLQYPVTFENKKAREVTFPSGEAFFKIAHDTSHPFIIHTSAGDVSVVGTSFNVVAGKDHLEVSVTEGKVLLINGADQQYLEPGMTGKIFKADSSGISVTSYTSGNSWGYATRKFIFKDTPLKQVITCLEKAYPCSIALQTNDIGNCLFTASLENVSAEYILNLIAETLNLTLAKNGREFIMEGKGCP
jgi:ferric-dicitrate binding protein FerR (iron transport regulator)